MFPRFGLNGEYNMEGEKMMTTKKNYLRLAVVCAMLTLIAVMAMACGKTPPAPNPEPGNSGTITLNHKSLSVELYDEATVTAQLSEGLSGAITWASGNTSIATVTEGKIAAVGTGETTVTASIGEVKSTCTVTVFDGGLVPTLIVADGLIETKVSLELNKQAAVNYKNTNRTASLNYEIADTTIATVSQDGVITGVKKGTTSLTISGSYNGYIFTPVTRSVVIKNNISIALNVAGLELALSNPDESHTTQATVTPVVYRNGEMVTTPVITWGSDSQEIAAVNTGLITAVGEGTTKIRATYSDDGDEVFAEVDINVYIPVVELDAEDIVIDLSKAESYMVSFTAPTEIVSIKRIEDITSSAKLIVRGALEASQIYLNTADIVEGERSYVLYTPTVGYKVSMVAATKVINSLTDLSSIRVTGNTLSGYYVLGRDIDATGSNGLNLVGTWTNKGSEGFLATFDGRGHSISNLSVNGGLFYCVGATGLIKNLALINISDTGTGGRAIANEFRGRLENVFVSGNTIRLTSGFSDSASMANVIAHMSSGSEAVATIYNATVTMSNVYIIGSKLYSAVAGGVSWTAPASAKAYVTVDAFAAAAPDLTDFGAVWNTSGKLPIIRSVATALQNSLDFLAGGEVFAGDTLTVANGSALFDYKLKQSVSGVSISATGVINVMSTVVNGTSFTVVVTSIYNSALTKEIIFNVSNITVVDKTADRSYYDFELYGNPVSYQVPLANGHTATEVAKLGGAAYSSSAWSTVSGSVTINKEIITLLLDGKTYGDYQLSIKTVDGAGAEYLYKVNVSVVTHIIDNAEELMSLNRTGSNDQSTLDVYYILSQDIDMTDYQTAFQFPVSWSGGGADIAKGWAGIFDGRGHVISKLKVTAQGMFCTVANSGVIRNVAFTGVTTLDGVRILANQFKGKISNVFASSNVATCLVNAAYGSAMRINNVITVLTATDSSVIMSWAVDDGTSIQTLADIHALSTLTTPKVAKSSYDPSAIANNAAARRLNAYASVTALLAGLESVDFAQNNWSGDWSYTASGLSFGGKTVIAAN